MFYSSRLLLWGVVYTQFLVEFLELHFEPFKKWHPINAQSEHLPLFRNHYWHYYYPFCFGLYHVHNSIAASYFQTNNRRVNRRNTNLNLSSLNLNFRTAKLRFSQLIHKDFHPLGMMGHIGCRTGIFTSQDITHDLRLTATRNQKYQPMGIEQ